MQRTMVGLRKRELAQSDSVIKHCDSCPVSPLPLCFANAWEAGNLNGPRSYLLFEKSSVSTLGPRRGDADGTIAYSQSLQKDSDRVSQLEVGIYGNLTSPVNRECSFAGCHHARMTRSMLASCLGHCFLQVQALERRTMSPVGRISCLSLFVICLPGFTCQMSVSGMRRAASTSHQTWMAWPLVISVQVMDSFERKSTCVQRRQDSWRVRVYSCKCPCAGCESLLCPTA